MTDDDEVLACPDCDRTPVVTNAPGGRSHGDSEDYRCARCGWKGDEPRRRPSRGDPDLRADSIAAKLDEADSLDELVTDGGVDRRHPNARINHDLKHPPIAGAKVDTHAEVDAGVYLAVRPALCRVCDAPAGYVITVPGDVVPLCETHSGREKRAVTDGGVDRDDGEVDRGAEIVGNSVFPYPGNKAKHAEWIVRQFPVHDCYVEPFGGAAGVLANKPESKVEVYNDRDGDLVQFFDVLRERGDDLADWLHNLPYAREKCDEWASDWYDGWRPDDPVRRAGVFFYLRATAFGAKYRYEGGFATSTSRNQAYTYQNQIERLYTFADRFRGQVVVENLDYQDTLDRWDGADTLFFLDPPYPDARFRYRHGKDFDHEAFANALQNTAGKWVVSYSDPAEPVLQVAETVVTRTTKYQMASGHNGAADEVTETLLLNYDPDTVDPFVDGQSKLDNFGAEPNGGELRAE